MQPARRAHEMANRALSFFSAAVKPGVTCARSTERGATALMSVSTYTPDESVASESFCTGSSPDCEATFSFAHLSTSASVSGFDEPDMAVRNLMTWYLIICHTMA